MWNHPPFAAYVPWPVFYPVPISRLYAAICDQIHYYFRYLCGKFILLLKVIWSSWFCDHLLIYFGILLYFCDSYENLITDLFLRENMDDYGWISVKLIASFKKVSSLKAILFDVHWVYFCISIFNFHVVVFCTWNLKVHEKIGCVMYVFFFLNDQCFFTPFLHFLTLLLY